MTDSTSFFSFSRRCSMKASGRFRKRECGKSFCFFFSSIRFFRASHLLSSQPTAGAMTSDGLSFSIFFPDICAGTAQDGLTAPAAEQFFTSPRRPEFLRSPRFSTGFQRAGGCSTRGSSWAASTRAGASCMKTARPWAMLMGRCRPTCAISAEPLFQNLSRKPAASFPPLRQFPGYFLRIMGRIDGNFALHKHSLNAYDTKVSIFLGEVRLGQEHRHVLHLDS